MEKLIEDIIQNAIELYDGSYSLGNSFEELLSFGELVDRLSIVNFKLYTLKNEVMLRSDQIEFCSWASIEDIRLVKERSRLKRCIDEKLISIIVRIHQGEANAGFNAEVKKYGDNI